MATTTEVALTRALFAILGVAFVEPGSDVPDAVRTSMDEFLSILRVLCDPEQLRLGLVRDAGHVPRGGHEDLGKRILG